MEKKSELTKWLHQQQSEGQIDSEGSFSIDKQKAWEKLGAFQLPFATAWVLKLVQALNSCAQAQGMKVTQNRVETVFHFMGVQDWTHETLESAIFNPEVRQDQDISHLAVAIRALAQPKDRPFSLSYPDGRTFIWNGTHFSEPAKSQNREDLTEDVIIGVELTVSHFRIGQSTSYLAYQGPEVKKLMLAISKTLHDDCYLSPCQITLDGLRIQGLASRLPSHNNNDIQILTQYAVKTGPNLPQCHAMFKLDKPRWDFNRACWAPGEKQSDCSAMAILVAYLDAQKVQGDYCYFKPSEGPMELHWIRLGVIVERERISYNSLANLILYITAEELNTDLTGLSLREDQLKKDRLDAAGAILSEQSFILSRNLEMPYVSMSKLDSKFAKTIHATGCLAGCVFGPFAWIVAYFINKARHQAAKKTATELPGKIESSARKLLERMRHDRLSDSVRQKYFSK